MLKKVPNLNKGWKSALFDYEPTNEGTEFCFYLEELKCDKCGFSFFVEKTKSSQVTKCPKCGL